VGVFHESSTEKAISTHQEYLARKAEVIQNHHVFRICAEELGPRDMNDIGVGDQIPADCPIIALMKNLLSVDQVTLTDKSKSISNNTHHIRNSIAVKQDQTKMPLSTVPPRWLLPVTLPLLMIYTLALFHEFQNLRR